MNFPHVDPKVESEALTLRYATTYLGTWLDRALAWLTYVEYLVLKFVEKLER